MRGTMTRSHFAWSRAKGDDAVEAYRPGSESESEAIPHHTTHRDVTTDAQTMQDSGRTTDTLANGLSHDDPAVGPRTGVPENPTDASDPGSMGFFDLTKSSAASEATLPPELRPWWMDEAEIQTWMTTLMDDAKANVEVLSCADQLHKQAVLFIHQEIKRDVFMQQVRKARLPLRAWKKALSETEAVVRTQMQDARRERDLQQVYHDMDRGIFDHWAAIESRVLTLTQAHGPDAILTSPPILALLERTLIAGYTLDEMQRLGRSAANGAWSNAKFKSWLQMLHGRLKAQTMQAKAQEHGLTIIEGADAPNHSEILPPTFDGMIIPDGYHVTPSGIGMITYNELGDPVERPIALWPMVILRHLVNADTDQEYAEVGWLSPHSESQWKRRIVSQGVISNAQQILQLADHGAPVNSNNTKGLIAYLESFIRLNAHRYPRVLATSRLGWQKSSRGFVAGNHQYWDQDGQPSLVEFLADSAGDQQKAEGFHAHGTFEEWLRIVDRVRDYPAVMIAVLASLATPLLHLVQAPNFVIDYGGNTSTGKTTSLELAASVWGQPDLKSGPAAMFSWASTHVGAETLSQLMSGMPVILDDTKTVQGNPRKVVEILYGVVSGMGKLRGAKAGGSRMTGHWRTILMSSGEQPVTSFSTDGGIKTRTLAITVRPFGQGEQTTLITAIKREMKAHYGHAGAAFAQWLLQHRAQWSNWAQDYQLRLAELGRNRTEGAARLMEYRGVLELTAALLDQAWASQKRSWTWADLIASTAWDALWANFEAKASDPLDLRQALRQFGSWAQAHAEEFMGRRTDENHPPLQWTGQWKLTSAGSGNPDELCVYTHILEKRLSDWGYFPESIINGWYDKRWLRRDPDGYHANPRIRIMEGPEAGQQKRVFYVLSPLGLQVAFDDEADDEANEVSADEESLSSYMTGDDADDYPI